MSGGLFQFFASFVPRRRRPSPFSLLPPFFCKVGELLSATLSSSSVTVAAARLVPRAGGRALGGSQTAEWGLVSSRYFSAVLARTGTDTVGRGKRNDGTQRRKENNRKRVNKKPRAELEGQKRQSQPLRLPLLLLTRKTAEPSQLDRWTGPRFDACCCCTAAAQCSVAWIPRVGIRVCLSCLDGDSESACASYPYRWCLQGQCQCLCPCPCLDSVVPVPVLTHARSASPPVTVLAAGGGGRREGRGEGRNQKWRPGAKVCGRATYGGGDTTGSTGNDVVVVAVVVSTLFFFSFGTLSARSSPSINGATDSRCGRG